ncbi:MAG: hypothetical protein JWM19_4040 [Actinomycetia bacterium]|nr:hypothetical protein [Actinomycetes bacterium]
MDAIGHGREVRAAAVPPGTAWGQKPHPLPVSLGQKPHPLVPLRRYTAELGQPGPREAVSRIRVLAGDGPVTLLTATKDIGRSQAAVLAGLLRETS